MPQKVLKFAGINRKVNEFQNSGACEELINLRLKADGNHGVVRPKDYVFDEFEYSNEFTYDTVYEHSFGNTTNMLGVKNGVVWYLYKDARPMPVIDEFGGKKGVTLSSAGNVLVVYCEEENKQVVYKYEDDLYKEFEINISPSISAYIDIPPSNCSYTADADAKDYGAFVAAMNKASSAFYSKYPNGLCGAAVIGCTYELKDGSEFWSTAFCVANHRNETAGYNQPVINKDKPSVTVYGAGLVRLIVNLNGEKPEDVKSINVYASKPVFPYEIEYSGSTLDRDAINIKELSLDDVNLEGQVMYYQCSLSPDVSEHRVKLNFGHDISSENIMNVDQGCIERFGNVVSYNNRFHYFGSDVYHIVQKISVENNYSTRVSEYMELTGYISYVLFNNKWILLKDVHIIGGISDVPISDFIYPLAGIKKIAFIKCTVKNGEVISCPYDEMFYVSLKDSSAYNYSCAFGVKPEIVQVSDRFVTELAINGQTWSQASESGFTKKVFLKNEPNAINVSHPYNPFAFPVDYSYSFGGEIKDISTAYTPISSVQAGQYPLTVFTSNGIYGLEQGNGDVLYSNVVPLQPNVIDGKAKATPHGTFFVSSKNLYLLSGREAINMSYLLNGKRETTLRDTRAYRSLCCQSESELYNFSDYLSKVDFEEFITDAVLNYDILNNELIMSSNKADIPYSYVLNIDTKMFHKVNKKYNESHNGARYIVDGNTGMIMDMNTEVNDEYIPVLLQSRPMSLELMYTHIQRLILLVDAKLNRNQNLCFSVFGSDNLHDWKCIISAQKKNTVLRQIRTNKSAKSYKDYIILINGKVDADTDLSEIIADYTVVSRRLG